MIANHEGLNYIFVYLVYVKGKRNLYLLLGTVSGELDKKNFLQDPGTTELPEESGHQTWAQSGGLSLW